MSFGLDQSQRSGLFHLNKLSVHQIENIFSSHVVALSSADCVVNKETVHALGGAENASQLIRSLKHLIRDVSFFALTHDQAKELLRTKCNGLSEQKVELLCKLCQENVSDWKRNQLESEEELLQDVEWNLKMISCTTDALVNEPRVQLQFKTSDKSISLDADQQGMRKLYNKLEEVQSKLDQIAKSSLEKK